MLASRSSYPSAGRQEGSGSYPSFRGMSETPAAQNSHRKLVSPADVRGGGNGAEILSAGGPMLLFPKSTTPLLSLSFSLSITMNNLHKSYLAHHLYCKLSYVYRMFLLL